MEIKFNSRFHLKIRQALTFFVLMVFFIISSCGEKSFLEDAVNTSRIFLESGDIITVSGGSVANSSSPFPLHQIHVFSKLGEYKGIFHNEISPSLLMGATLNYSRTGLLYTIDNVDRVEEINFIEQTTPTVHILNSNLSGNTLRSIAVLSDGGTIVAESTASFEKYDSSGTRVTTNFPITVSATIMKVRSISQNRFALLYTGGNDSISIRNNDGTLVTTIASGLACGNNCDPSDILELSDGRFVVAYNNAAAAGLHLYNSSFARIGTLYQNTSVIQGISALALLSDNDILACSTSLNVCEKFLVTGDTASRVGTNAFISDSGKMRQPTDVVVVP